MLIGVVSDTHLRGNDNRFYILVEKFFKNCSYILHAGDITDTKIFEGIDKEIIAVKGNMDFGQDLPLKRVIEIENVRLGLIHGYGEPRGIEMRVIKEFEKNPVDCIVFGHTHMYYIGEIGGIKLFNPGSPFDSRYGCRKSVGFIEVNGKEINLRIEEI
ncbi:MAG: metallophosphoesterase [Proteobacteria bacterium]|nr:metallophosphoesterase [Pseudomonadota bacterium]